MAIQYVSGISLYVSSGYGKSPCKRKSACGSPRMTKKIYHFGLADLQKCVDLSDVAHLLGVEPRFLSKMIYKTPDAAKYSTFDVPKKTGGVREIFSPHPNLKFMQSRLSRLLYQCYLEIFDVPKNPLRVISHGFQKNRGLSIYTNARKHTSRRHVFNLDLEDFFPSFNFGRVRGFFLKHDKLKVGEKAATAIAQLACFQNRLPQGAPSSPIISEFLSQPMDIALQKLATKHRCSYSRYADDITFSTNLKEFPDEIALASSDPPGWVAGESLLSAINSCGFQVNPKKTRMQIRNQWQSVTSLTVNSKVNIRKDYYKGVRYCAYGMMKTGHAYAKTGISPDAKVLTPNQVWGMLRHVCDIKDRSVTVRPLRQYTGSNLAPHYLRLSGDFFHFQRIHLSSKPLIVCEGKTDYVYLKEAIIWHKSDPRVQSNLIDIAKFPTKGKKSNGDHWGVDFVKHSEVADRLLDISGGGGNLVKFCANHIERTKRFVANPAVKPVIVVVDNDSQSEGMWAFIKTQTQSKAKIDGSKPYYRVSDSLYVVPIPRLAGSPKDFYIELLFPDKWLKAPLDGRKAKLHQKKDEKLSSSEYGKGEFANKVIRANRGSVDCSAFGPLLQTICDVIEGKAT